MPVVRHAGRHVDRVTCLPFVALTIDERIAASLEHVEHRLAMGVAVALRMRGFLEDRRHRDRLRAKAVRLVGGTLAAAHEDPDAGMPVRALVGLRVRVRDPGVAARVLVHGVLEV